MESIGSKYVGIRGWLLVFVIVMLLRAIGQLQLSVGQMASRDVNKMIDGFIMLVITAITITAFIKLLRRRHSAIAWSYASLFAHFAFVATMLILAIRDGDAIGAKVFQLFWREVGFVLIGTLYLMNSRRVKATLTR